jgi:hypothetical protein
METDVANQFALEWIKDWNSHNLSQIMAHYADEITFISPFIKKLNVSINGLINDKDSLEMYFKIALEKYPDLKFELIHCLVGVNSVVLYYKSVNDLLSAEHMEFSSQGKVNRVVAHYVES